MGLLAASNLALIFARNVHHTVRTAIYSQTMSVRSGCCVPRGLPLGHAAPTERREAPRLAACPDHPVLWQVTGRWSITRVRLGRGLHC